MEIWNLNLFILVTLGFISTNLDNLSFLVLLQGSSKKSRHFSILGFVAASTLVIAVAFACAILGDNLDGKYVGFLGLIPVILGVKAIKSAYFDGEGASSDTAGMGSRSGLDLTLGTFTLMLANSGDTLALMLPLIIDTRAQAYPIMALNYAAMVALWATIARWLAEHKQVSQFVDRHGKKIVPWAMIGVGL
jgi:cadmium resistance protein CadD (predicted permease)